MKHTASASVTECAINLHLVKFPEPLPGKLPIKPDAKRGSERIRARAYRDPRLTGNVLLLVLAISEFVKCGAGQPVATLKLATIRKWTHGKDRATRYAIAAAVELGVLVVDRKRTCQRYVFLDAWLDWFGAAPEPIAKAAARDAEPDARSAESASLRSADSASHDRQNLPVTVVPVLLNQEQQQQQEVEGGADALTTPPLGPSPRQMRGIVDMARELGEEAPQPATRAEASDVFRTLKRRVSARRQGTNRQAFAQRRQSRQMQDYSERLRASREQHDDDGLVMGEQP